MTNYENFVTNYRRYQYAPRTLSEAFRDAEYGTAIQRYAPDHSLRSDVIIEVLVLLIVSVTIGYMLGIYLN